MTWNDVANVLLRSYSLTSHKYPNNVLGLEVASVPVETPVKNVESEFWKQFFFF